MANYNPEHEAVLHRMLQDVPGARPGKMFGFPAYKVNGKLAVGQGNRIKNRDRR